MKPVFGPPKRGLPLSLPLSMMVEIQRARAELETIETPWEPYRELATILADARPRIASGKQFFITPWRLVGTLHKSVEHAKDCSTSNIMHLVGLMHKIEKKVEARTAVDRLADVVG